MGVEELAVADPGPEGECWKPGWVGGAAGRSMFPLWTLPHLLAGGPISQTKQLRLREVEGWAAGNLIAELSWKPGLLTPLGLSPFPCLCLDFASRVEMDHSEAPDLTYEGLFSRHPGGCPYFAYIPPGPGHRGS